MKFIRAISLMLIFMIAVSPALASNCAAACASQTVMSSIKVNVMATNISSARSMSGMMNCHESDNSRHDKSSNNNNIDATHKTCAMGAGCHYSQVPPIVTSAKYAQLNTSNVSFPKLIPTEKSVDFSPPLKPPA